MFVVVVVCLPVCLFVCFVVVVWLLAYHYFISCLSQAYFLISGSDHCGELLFFLINSLLFLKHKTDLFKISTWKHPWSKPNPQVDGNTVEPIVKKFMDVLRSG